MGLFDAIKRTVAPIVTPLVAPVVAAVEEHAPAAVKGAVDAIGVAMAPAAAVTHLIDPVVVPVLDHVLQKVAPDARIGIAVGTIGSLAPNAVNRPPLRAVTDPPPTPTTGNEITTLVDGDEYKTALVGEIGAAKKSIWIETWEWQDNTTGKEVAQALLDAKKKATSEGRELDVRVIYDNRKDVMSVAGGTKGEPMPLLADLRAAGVDVRQSDYSALRVNHRKLSVFDGETTFVGGQNIGDSYLLPLSAGWSYHDVTQRVSGPAAQDSAKVFADSWYRAGGERLAIPPRAAARKGDASVQVLRHSGGIDRNIERELVQRIDDEREEIVLANGFGMSDAIKNAAIRAQRRGVKVTWLWGKASHQSALMAQESFDELRAAGVAVQKYPGPMHMKAAYFRSDDVLIQGSSNLDGFSTFVNDEAVLQIKGGGEPREFYDRVLVPDLAKSTPITGPVEAPASRAEGLGMRILERVADGDQR